MKMKKSVCLVLSLLMLCALLPCGTAEEAADTPKLFITYAPVYGERAPFAGYVEAADPTAYRISLYLQLSEDQQYWVKPYADNGTYHSYAVIGEDGTFTIPYVTGGTDQKAQVLHMMIVPGDYIPRADFEETRAVALDYIRIDRTPDGAVTLPEGAVRAEEEAFNEAGKPSGLKVNAGMLAVDVGPYTSGNNPDLGDPVREEDIRAQLTALLPYADTVRFYASDELKIAYPIAREMGYRIIGTAWLSGNPEADQTELDALIANCNAGLCDMAVVGSETQLRGDLAADVLLGYIDYVKAGITDESIAVTTADNASFLLADSKLAAACDVLFVNVYPFWGGSAIENAPADFAGLMQQLRERCPNKEIICSETGWPTEGTPVGDAVPGEEAAAAYFTAIREWSLAEDVLVVYFDGADEPWKASAEGDVGAHWGFFTNGMVLKPAYAETEFFAGK